MAVFKYSTCVKTCPNSDNRTEVQCLQPKIFNVDQPGKFINCTFYVAGGIVKGNNGPGLRYETTLSKKELFLIKSHYSSRQILPTWSQVCDGWTETLRWEILQRLRCFKIYCLHCRSCKGMVCYGYLYRCCCCHFHHLSISIEMLCWCHDLDEYSWHFRSSWRWRLLALCH